MSSERRLSPLALALALVVVMASVGTAPSASAQVDEYQTIVVDAVREYDAHNYPEALALFLRAHALRPSARTERGLANTLFELRRYVEAETYFVQALADERNPLTPEMRTAVEALLARARAFIGGFRFEVSPPGAIVRIDGREIQGEVRLDAGDHELSASAEGHRPLVRALRVVGGEDETVSVALLPIEPVVVVAPPPSVAAERPSDVAVVLGITGVVLGGVFLAGGIASHAIREDSVMTLNASSQCSTDDNGVVFADAPASCLDLQQRYRAAEPWIYAGYIGGAALLTTGVILLLTAPTTAAPRESSVACGSFADLGITCAGRF